MSLLLERLEMILNPLSLHGCKECAESKAEKEERWGSKVTPELPQHETRLGNRVYLTGCISLVHTMIATWWHGLPQ